ncbi:unnamed protein product [Wickerhamomyces anomalus]
MDISDKNFKPCPCGYQVCQFCYNNIRQNPELNGRCPACRRPYDDESVEYKIVSQEEWKYEQSKQSRKDRERKQKEKEKKENEQASRKHLAGMRVIQKNLVYVVGLNPPVPPEELHTILRSDKYFGQYGKILKIVINKRNPPPNAPAAIHHHHNNGNAGFGVYVTFSKKEEATRCINAIDGTYIDGRPLKAAYGTTKYCSSYLRGQPCPNPNCMFLHEPGEEADSYTRQDLSTRQGLKMGADQGLPSSSQTSLPLQQQGSSSNISNGVGYKSNSSFTTRHSNNSQFFNHHHQKEQEDVSSTSSHHQPILGSAPLPATASWASNIPQKTSNVSSPVITSSVLANSSAFPTLAESTTLQQQQHQQQQHQARKQKNQSANINDEFNCESSAISFIDETINLLNSFPKFEYQIKSNLVDEETLNSFPPLFAFANIKVNNTSSSFNIKLVESLISKPKVLSPEEQQAILQQQIQPQPILQQPQAQIPQQLTPSQQPQQLNDLAQVYAQQQQQQQQNQPQQQFFSPQATAALLQQQFQGQDGHSQAQLLQEQLRQQQQQQILLNQLKNERNYTATPPPPGLFQQSNSNSNPTPVSANESHVGGTASELLNHLMNGKKIST